MSALLDKTIRVSLSDTAWVEVIVGFIPEPLASEIFETLRSGLSWEQRSIVLFGKKIAQPRLIAWAGAVSYRYSGQTLEPRPASPSVLDLMERVEERVGVAFNHVLVNRYRDGNDSMGWHADNEPELGPNPTIASLSLGAVRRFVIKPRRGRSRATALDLPHGSLLIMGGDCQTHFRHALPRSPNAPERINVTFRQIIPRPP